MALAKGSADVPSDLDQLTLLDVAVPLSEPARSLAYRAPNWPVASGRLSDAVIANRNLTNPRRFLMALTRRAFAAATAAGVAVPTIARAKECPAAGMDWMTMSLEARNLAYFNMVKAKWSCFRVRLVLASRG
jgi:hypothetical protein